MGLRLLAFSLAAGLTASTLALDLPATAQQSSKSWSVADAKGSQTPVKTGSETGSAPPKSKSEETKLKLKPVEDVANQWLKRGELQHSLVGLEIMHIPSGQVMFGYNARRRFVTASIAKVITTACAMEELGATNVFRTRLLAGGPIVSGRLRGNLVVEPSQDPSLTSDDIRGLLASVLPNKIKFVDGRITIEPAIAGGDWFQSEWLIQDWGQDWMPVSSDLVIDHNLIYGRDPAMGCPLITKTAAEQNDALMRSLLMSQWAPAWVTFDQAAHAVYLNRLVIPAFGKLVIGNPTQYNTAYLKYLLSGLGTRVEGHEYPPAREQTLLGAHDSKPLSEVIRFTLKKSDNLYAQQLLRTIGTLPAINSSVEKSILEERGLARVRAWLAQIGADSSEIVLYDGCGLSRKNAITPHALDLILRHMAGPQGNGPFIDLMIHEGEGTSRTFRFKTGAMDSVRSICGVVKTACGEPLAVTAIINAHTPMVRDLRASLGSLVEKLQDLGPLSFDIAPEILAKQKLHPLKPGAGPGKSLPRHVGRGTHHHH